MRPVEASACSAIIRRGPNEKPSESRSGSLVDDAAKDEFARAEEEAVADRDPGAGHELTLGERARQAVGSRRGADAHVAAAFDRDRADERDSGRRRP